MTSNSNPTQCEMILGLLKDGHAISPWYAMKEVGVMRLAARIWELRKDGHKIGERWVKKNNRFGVPVQFKEYFLEVEL